MSRTINAAIRAAPTTAPTTIPAIAPPDNPLCAVELGAAAVVEAAAEVGEVDDAVGELVEKVMKPVIVGSTTLAHLCSASEL